MRNITDIRNDEIEELIKISGLYNDMTQYKIKILPLENTNYVLKKWIRVFHDYEVTVFDCIDMCCSHKELQERVLFNIVDDNKIIHFSKKRNLSNETVSEMVDYLIIRGFDLNV